MVAYQNSVVSAWLSTSLRVTEGGDTGVEPESVDQDVFDVFWLDRVQVSVDSALGDDDD